MRVSKSTARVISATQSLLPFVLTLGRGILEKVIARSPDGPEGDARDALFEILVESRRGAACTRVFVTGRDPYGLTAEIQALYAARAVDGALLTRGVVAPSEAIDPEDAMRDLRPTGLEMHTA